MLKYKKQTVVKTVCFLAVMEQCGEELLHCVSECDFGNGNRIPQDS